MHSHVQQAFTILFCIELAINMFAKSRNHFKPFYSDNWNLFDFFVVFMYLSTRIHTCLHALAHTSASAALRDRDKCRAIVTKFLDTAKDAGTQARHVADNRQTKECQHTHVLIASSSQLSCLRTHRAYLLLRRAQAFTKRIE